MKKISSNLMSPHQPRSSNYVVTKPKNSIHKRRGTQCTMVGIMLNAKTQTSSKNTKQWAENRPAGKSQIVSKAEESKEEKRFRKHIKAATTAQVVLAKVVQGKFSNVHKRFRLEFKAVHLWSRRDSRRVLDLR